jgi:uncharacterized DUF497 family protein
MLFDWDKEKNKSNIIKHGIDFRDALKMFAGPMLIKEDTREDYGERRWISIGELNEIVVVMVFTIRGKIVRIISVRKANQKERESYYGKIK